MLPHFPPLRRTDCVESTLSVPIALRMHTTVDPIPEALARRQAAAEPYRFVRVVGLGILLMYLPSFWDWAQGEWRSETQGHEALILAVSVWLLYRRRRAIAALPLSASTWPGNLLLGVALTMYVIGRSQMVLRVELLSMTLLFAALLLRSKGFAALKIAWFPLVFQLFALPLPFDLVLTLTGPLKLAVSAAATWILAVLGYPVGRSGVVMTVGQYQLLVTEACAGLQTMFTLEAMGLLYASLTSHGSALRNGLLAVLVIPVSFAANVIRVVVLALVTYYFGDAAGQGFLHGFAGLLLFLVALLLIGGLDRVLCALLPSGAEHAR